ncbi:MAG TPA: hypothetical protein VG796_07445 [Verrucomicrobiales bacterium]|nr:hypothetical protein [Verrucomicrobiales bacterium]
MASRQDLRGALELVEAFSAAPVAQWRDLWAKFADHTSAAGLEDICALVPRDQKSYYSPPAVEYLRALSQEELAVRTRRAKLEPGAFAALAESDPGEAWEQLKRNNQQALSCVVLRTLAWRDPADALRRWRALPKGTQREEGEDERAVFTPSPVGSIFGAWGRRDPAAALAVSKAERLDGAAEFYLSWAFRGPAALRHIAASGWKDHSSYAMEIIVRAAFQLAPAATAKLMNESSVLRKRIGTLRVFQPWYRADPQSALAWLQAEHPGGDSFVFDRLSRSDPATAAEIMRRFPKPEYGDHSHNIALISRSDPALGAALADEFDLRSQVEAALREVRIRENPSAACDEWTAAVRRHGPDGALAALGWSADAARNLAAFSANVFPDKAKELAALVPASILAGNDKSFRSEKLGRFWPELAYVPPAPTPFSQKEDRNAQIARNPAAAAEAVLTNSPDAGEVWNVMRMWAPYDATSARAWLNRIPEGSARQAGELAMAGERASDNPLEVLKLLSGMSPELLKQHSRDAGRLWITCLQRLVVNGGDWRPWLDRLPPAIKTTASQVFIGSDPAGSLEAEAQLLTTLRKTAQK